MKMHSLQLIVRQAGPRGPAVLVAVVLAAAALSGCALGPGSSMGGPSQDQGAASETRSNARTPRPADAASPRMGGDNAAGESGSGGGTSP